MITINLCEENNKLFLKSPFNTVVCGNSNYEIEIDFSEDWAQKNVKTALIIVKGQKKSVEFTGNKFDLPRIPNCTTFLIVLFAHETYGPGLVTASIELEATPTAMAEDIPEFEDIDSYAFEILKRLDGFTDGSTKVKHAEQSDTAVYSPNPNLLINGAFTVDQSQSTYYYTTKDMYIADRWFASEGLIFYKESPIAIAKQEDYEVCYLKQIIDYIDILAGKDLCLSICGPDYFTSFVVKFDSEKPSEDTLINSKEISDGVTLQFYHLASGNVCVQLEIRTAEEFHLNYIKLEYGLYPTQYIPTTYGEELIKCQRYRYVIPYSAKEPFVSAVGDGLTNQLHFIVYLPMQLRTKKVTVTSTGEFELLTSPCTGKLSKFTLESMGKNFVKLYLTGDETYEDGKTFLVYVTRGGILTIDAEIYP